MTWQELQKFIQGKVFLVGLTFVDQEENVIGNHETHGTVIELSSKGVLKFKRSDGSIFQMPYDKDTIKKAEKGEYREKSTGLVVVDPDYIMTWDIVTTNDDFEDIKQNGFISNNK